MVACDWSNTFYIYSTGIGQQHRFPLIGGFRGDVTNNNNRVIARHLIGEHIGELVPDWLGRPCGRELMADVSPPNPVPTLPRHVVLPIAEQRRFTDESLLYSSTV
uniref:Transposase n=1 Tax=Knipowitschia caucasica TaxID=637954 RepID=A0AAV2MLN2_KNICA